MGFLRDTGTVFAREFAPVPREPAGLVFNMIQPLLFLDEPTTGLDPRGRAEIWAHIRRLRAEHGTTLFLTTHYLDEADAMAERVVIVDAGRVIADGTAARLKADLAGDHITVTTRDGEHAAAAAIAVRLTGRDADVTCRDGTVRLRVPDASAALPGYLRALDAAGAAAVTAETSRPTLDDVFLALTGRTLDDRGDAAPTTAAPATAAGTSAA